MKKGMCKDGVPFLVVAIHPRRVKHVFGKKSPIPKPNEGENYGESKDIIGYHTLFQGWRFFD